MLLSHGSLYYGSYSPIVTSRWSNHGYKPFPSPKLLEAWIGWNSHNSQSCCERAQLACQVAIYLLFGSQLKAESSGAPKAVCTPPVCNILSYYHNEYSTLGGNPLIQLNLTLKCTVMNCSSCSALNQRFLAPVREWEGEYILSVSRFFAKKLVCYLKSKILLYLWNPHSKG